MQLKRTVQTMAVSGAVVTAVLAGSTGTAFAAHEGDIFAVDINNQLLQFDPGSPQTIDRMGQITGLTGGEVVLGIDFRPADGEIYAVTDQERVYRIEYRPTGFGTATQVSTLTNSDTAGPAIDITAQNIGFDFNPVVDRLRIVTESRSNFRTNVDTGATIVDGTLTYAAGDPNAGRSPRVTAAAYENPDNDPNTGTELYDIDPGQNGMNDQVLEQDPPNSGTLNTIGVTDRNSTQLFGYDIGLDGVGFASSGGTDPNPTLLRIVIADDDTVTTTSAGSINSGELRDITIALPDPDGAPGGGGPAPVVPEVPYTALLLLAGAAVGATVIFRRRAQGQAVV